MRRARFLFAALAIAATVLAGSSGLDDWSASSAASAVGPSSGRLTAPALDALDGRRWAALRDPGGRRWFEASLLAGRRWEIGAGIDGRRWASIRAIDGIRWPVN